VPPRGWLSPPARLSAWPFVANLRIALTASWIFQVRNTRADGCHTTDPISHLPRYSQRSLHTPLLTLFVSFFPRAHPPDFLPPMIRSACSTSYNQIRPSQSFPPRQLRIPHTAPKRCRYTLTLPLTLVPCRRDPDQFKVFQTDRSRLRPSADACFTTGECGPRVWHSWRGFPAPRGQDWLPAFPRDRVYPVTRTPVSVSPVIIRRLVTGGGWDRKVGLLRSKPVLAHPASLAPRERLLVARGANERLPRYWRYRGIPFGENGFCGHMAR